MEELKDLVYIFTRQKLSQIDVVTNPIKKANKEDSRYWQAYAGLCEGKWKTDEAFVKHFNLELGSRQYNRFIQNLFERILNSAFFLNDNDSESGKYRQACLDIIRDSCLADILRRKGSSAAFFKISHNALNLAIKYEEVSYVLELSKRLKSAYLISPKHHKEYEEMKKLQDEYLKIYLAEIEITNAYQDFIRAALNKKGYKSNMAPMVEKIIDEYAHVQVYSQSMIQYYYRHLMLYSKVLKHQWEDGLAIAKDAVEYYKGKPFFNQYAILAFNIHQVGCLLMLRKYNEAISICDENEKLGLEGVSPWFKNRELRTAVLFYAQRWTDAWATVKGAMQHQKYKDLTPLDQEAWRLYYGYIVFVLRFKKVTLAEDDMTEVNKFRIISWSNDMTLLSQDKQGSNIPLRILQILFLIYEGKFDKLEEQVDALQKYRHRHFDRESEHYRTDCFIALLVLLPKYATQPDELHARAQEWLEKLRENPNPIFDQSYETEILQYELAWAWMAEMAIAHEQG